MRDGTDYAGIKAPAAKDLIERELFFGHKGCAGCGAAVAVRLALKVLGERTYAALPAGCMSAVGFIWPQMAFGINAEISTFPGTASMLSGLRAALKRQGLDDVHVVGFAGDGGTADIGLQALSGAIDRNDRVIYVCYDNEAYMNTGIQKSGLTPLGARTTTTPAGSVGRGSVTAKKRLFEIVAAHGIGYAATASIGYPQDYMDKIARAAACPGTSFVHVLASCPTGWGTPTETAIEIAKEAVDCGLWHLAEFSGEGFRLNRDPSAFASAREYLRKQGRFKHLSDAELDAIEAARDDAWARMRAQWARPGV
jgi:pyruvate ferredoxin oxidoreductase beta subunit